MTKMKSKKMTKSTFAIIVMAIALVALLAFGGTYAYFTSTANKVTSTFTTGIISVKKNTITTVKTDKVVPTEKVAEGIKFVNDSTAAAYIFVKVAATYTKGENQNKPVPSTVLNVTPATAEGWAETKAGSGIYYQKTTNDAPKTGDMTVCGAIVFNADNHYTEGEFDDAKSDDVDLMGATVTITIETYAVQAIKNDTTEFTLDEALAQAGLSTAA